MGTQSLPVAKKRGGGPKSQVMRRAWVPLLPNQRRAGAFSLLMRAASSGACGKWPGTVPSSVGPRPLKDALRTTVGATYDFSRPH
jgi:hypothetical protein